MIQAKEINIQQTSETICKSDILCKLYNYRFWGKGRYALKNKKNNAVLFYVKLTIYLKDLKLTALRFCIGACVVRHLSTKLLRDAKDFDIENKNSKYI